MRAVARVEPASAAPFSTPALVVDLDVFEANVATMGVLLRDTGKSLRPHVKTHRTPELARRQLGGAAAGVTCSTIGEAEAMVAAGIGDVLLANEVVDPAKIERLALLATMANVSVAADDPGPVRELSRAAVVAGVTVGVLVDVDILLHRCGVDSTDAAILLAQAILDLPGLRLVGLMGYEGRLRQGADDRDGQIRRAYAILADTRAALVGAGIPVTTVSAAGTSTLREALADPCITEIQAGVYSLMEPELLGMDLPFQCAAAIRGTVISRHPGRVVLDVGRRAVGMEYGPPVPVGFEATSISVSDEHTIISMDAELPPLGAELDLVPAQIRTTFNLHDHVWVSRGGAILDRWPITARGSSE
jgi:D-serine deaminase-like pyridoxal phosphate-dependent protein